MTDTTQQAKEQAIGVARAVGEAVGKKVDEVADRSRRAGADALAGYRRAADDIADSVGGDFPAIADYVRGAGAKIDSLAESLREKKVAELVTIAADFGRTQPVVLLAGAAVVGFALSRLIKAGVASSAVARKDGEGEDAQ